MVSQIDSGVVLLFTPGLLIDSGVVLLFYNTRGLLIDSGVVLLFTHGLTGRQWCGSIVYSWSHR